MFIKKNDSLRIVEKMYKTFSDDNIENLKDISGLYHLAIALNTC